MPPRSLTHPAKPYVPVTSASIDPYEEGQSFLVDDDRLDSWLLFVTAELQRYRSPFVAAEALLTEMRRFSHELYHPERLYISTALRILQACVPHLSKETAQVMQAAVHELLPCLVYTRRTPLTIPYSAPFPSKRIEKVSQLTYAGAFRLLSARWEQYQRKLQQLKRHVRTQKHVTDRLVHGLDDVWVKICFYSWRTFCREMKARKAQLRRRLQRAAASEVVPSFLRLWRQYARKIAWRVKISSNDTLQQQLEELYPLEQEAKHRYDHLFEEVKEKTRLVGDSLARLSETQSRYKALEDLINETDVSLTDHWGTWKRCMRLMFDDVGVLPGKDEESLRPQYIMNITDTASILRKRARGVADRIGLRHIAQLLLFEGELGTDEAVHFRGRAGGMMNSVLRIGSSLDPSPRMSYLSVLTPSSSASGSHSTRTITAAQVKKKTARRANLRSPVPDRRYSPVRWATEVTKLFWTVTAVISPVVTPFRLMDVLHSSETHFNITLSFLSAVYSGGHCSVFVHQIDEEEESTSSSLPLLSGETSGKVLAVPDSGVMGSNTGKSTSREEVKWGSLMMQDMMSGIQRVQVCSDSNERYLQSLHGAMMMKEMDSVHGYLEDLYNRWSATGLPLSRKKLEAAWLPIVKPDRLPILYALFPKSGVGSFTGLIHYVTRVAEFSGCSLQGLAERLDVTYTFDLLDELRVFRSSDVATALFSEHMSHLTTVCEWLKDEADSSRYNLDHLSLLLKHQFGLSQEDAAEVSRYARSESGPVVSIDDIEWLLLFGAPYVNPSPFIPLLEKVSTLLDDCTLFFRQLSTTAKKGLR